MQWTSEADAKLFMLMIKIHAIKVDYDSLSRAMSKAMDTEITPKAITHRIQKLRTAAGVGNVSGGAESNLGSIPTPNRRVSAKQKAAVAQTTTTTPTNAVPAVKPVNAPSLGTGAGIKRGRATETGSPLANEYDYGNDETRNEATAFDTEDAAPVGRNKRINRDVNNSDDEEDSIPPAKKPKYSKSLGPSQGR